jgi:enoyl-CoA hydratase
VSGLETLTYEVSGRVARITPERPERGNGITPGMTGELAACVERANLDPAVHVIALAGNGAGFWGGYDLVEFAEGAGHERADDVAPGSPLDPEVQAETTIRPVPGTPEGARLLRGRRDRHGAVGRPPGHRLGRADRIPAGAGLGVPTTALWVHRVGPERAKRLLFTGDLINGEAHRWGLAIDAPAELDARFEALLERVALTPVNQPVMMKLLVNQALYAQGLHATQLVGTLLDGMARHTPEGYAFQRRAAEAGWPEAVRERDEPYG